MDMLTGVFTLDGIIRSYMSISSLFSMIAFHLVHVFTSFIVCLCVCARVLVSNEKREMIGEQIRLEEYECRDGRVNVRRSRVDGKVRGIYGQGTMG